MRKLRPLPSVDELSALLNYDPATGLLIWRPRNLPTWFNGKHAGKPAGGLTHGRADGSNRYVAVGLRINGKYQQFGAHRLIWKMMTGEDPPEFIDHEDGDELNLKWSNLRPANNGQNIQNSRLRKDNMTGVKGVCWDAWHKKWSAQIAIFGKQRRVGRFTSFNDAVAAITAERVKLHGEFARME